MCPPRSVRWLAAFGRVTAFALALPAAHAQVTFEGLGDLPGGDFVSFAEDVSADGSVVVGAGANANGDMEAFRWTTAGGMQGLDDLPGGGTNSQATAVSADGSVVVGLSGSANGSEAFRWEAGAMVGLGDLPGGSFTSQATGVSADGAVVVGYSTADGPSEVAFRWTHGTGMVTLGDLPGGDFNSEAHAVSSDGSVVVGFGSNATVREAFRWTQAGGMQGLGTPDGRFNLARAVSADGSVLVGVRGIPGGSEAFRWQAGVMQGLGDLDGGDIRSEAYGVSGDGSVVVGIGHTATGDQAFIWTAADGMRSLRDVLVAAGVDMTGWTLYAALDVSADGNVIVGAGINPSGQQEAWRVVLSSLTVFGPPAGSRLVGGTRYRIRWTSPGLPFVDLSLLPDTLGGAPLLVASVPGTDTSYVWTVPDDVFSRSARLVLADALDPSVADTSDFFRVRPYHLARLAADSVSYTPFRPSLHGWPFGNTQANLFPPVWFGQEQFDYQDGTDPFTNLGYPAYFTSGPPVNAVPVVFADWPAFVRAFGTDDAYWVQTLGVYENAFIMRWAASHGGRRWNGSCYGMAVGSLQAFTDRLAFGAAYPDIGPVENLVTVGMTDRVREIVNMQYARQFGLVPRTNDAANLPATTPRQTLAQLKSLLLSDASPGGTQRHLAIYDVTACAPGFTSQGGHSVVPYRLARDPAVQGAWRVSIYDPNYPLGNGQVIVLDSTANTWSYTGFSPAWSGACGFYLEPPIVTFYQEATPRQPGGGLLASGTRLYVAAAPGADVTLTDAQGRSMGYAAGAVFGEIPGASTDVPKVGGPAPPTGYFVPDGPYSVTMGAFPENRAAAYFFPPGAGEPIYAYGRSDAGATHIDHLVYNPAPGEGLHARSEDVGTTKVVALRALIADDTLDRTLDARDLPLSGPDSVHFAVIDAIAGPALRLANEGGPKTYTLRLQQNSEDGEAVFQHELVTLPAGATHTARPVWATLGPPDATVLVDVDLNGDGIPDEVLVLENQPVANEPGVPPAGPPTMLALHAPSPNPAAGRTALRYDLPTAGHVRLAVYDALGREVAVLVDGDVPSGRHEAILEVGRLAPGVYVLRMTAGAGAAVRRLTVTR